MLFQQLRIVESCRAFLREAARFTFSLPRVVGLARSSLRRRVRKLRRFPRTLMRRTVVADLVGEPETLLLASTLLSVMHPSRLVSLNLRASEAQPG